MRTPLPVEKYALKLVAGRDKTEAQVRAALARRAYSDAEVDAAVAGLKKYGYLNDGRSAEERARRALTAMESRAATHQRLMALGLGEATARAVVERVAAELNHDDASAARAVLKRRRLSGMKGARFLASRGFDEELIRSVVPDLNAE